MTNIVFDSSAGKFLAFAGAGFVKMCDNSPDIFSCVPASVSKVHKLSLEIIYHLFCINIYETKQEWQFLIFTLC